jgi:hypothetical protein
LDRAFLCPAKSLQPLLVHNRFFSRFPLGCLARISLQKERPTRTRNATNASATRTMPRTSSICLSTNMLARTPSEEEDLPFARWDRISGRFPPKLALIRHQETAERGVSPPSPILGTRYAGRASNRIGGAQCPKATLRRWLMKLVAHRRLHRGRGGFCFPSDRSEVVDH